MTDSRRNLTPLHMGKCIEDLDQLHIIQDLKTKRPSLLCKSAQKLFEKAEESYAKSDEEHAYILYMKYLRIVAYLTSEKSYQKDKAYYTTMLGTKNPKKAIDAAEKLKNSLIERYAQAAVKENQTGGENENNQIEPLAKLEPAPTAGLPGVDEVIIRSEQLYPLLKAGKLRVMILDARPGRDFMDSHINHAACISVPEECISPGQSANVLEQNLPLTSRAVWAERAAAELIVMLDWSSVTIIPAKTLFLLKTILLKWDIKVQYSRPPLALWGGYEDWLLKYPALTTNPQAVLPSQSQMMDDMLGEIDYPNWHDLTLLAPVTAAHSSGSRAPRMGEPRVDRSSKAAAVQMYEERSRGMQMILEQQEKIADTSLTLEMQRVEAEQSWKVVRSQREGEQRDELRLMYQLREQEITSQLMQMENKQYDMQQENQSLRDQLEEYQRREREDTDKMSQNYAAVSQPAPNEEAERKTRLMEQACAARVLAAKRARIAAVTEQRDQLDRQREAMENERKRKLAEARDKKKPDLDKDEDGDTYMSSPGDGPSAPHVKRSESEKNILPVIEEAESLPPVPTFDRSTKPTKAVPTDRQRDFEPFYGNTASDENKEVTGVSIVRKESEPRCIPLDAAGMVLKVKVRLKYSQNQIIWLFRRGRGLTGLMNLGNTCYMNSIIQCLNNTAELITYFCNDRYKQHINRSHSTRGAIAEEVAAVVRALWSEEYSSIAPKDLRYELGKHQRAFRTSAQQDSHEFLTILMDWLHQDLQYPVQPPHKESLTPSEKAWLEYTKCKESCILRLFYGQIKSTVKCLVCGKQSVTYEPFSNLSLELPPHSNRCTLSDCLKLYLSGEKISEWNCPTCKEKRDAVKKLDISRLPPILVIHFKRFFVDHADANSTKYLKKLTYIDFPLSGLDMRPFSLSATTHAYDLYGVSDHFGSIEKNHSSYKHQPGHYGSIESGHYTASCKSTVYDKWYKYDDHLVTELQASEVRSSAAYILFYSCSRAK